MERCGCKLREIGLARSIEEILKVYSDIALALLPNQMLRFASLIYVPNTKLNVYHLRFFW